MAEVVLMSEPEFPKAPATATITYTINTADFQAFADEMLGGDGWRNKDAMLNPGRPHPVYPWMRCVELSRMDALCASIWKIKAVFADDWQERLDQCKRERGIT